MHMVMLHHHIAKLVFLAIVKLLTALRARLLYLHKFSMGRITAKYLQMALARCVWQGRIILRSTVQGNLELLARAVTYALVYGKHTAVWIIAVVVLSRSFTIRQLATRLGERRAPTVTIVCPVVIDSSPLLVSQLILYFVDLSLHLFDLERKLVDADAIFLWPSPCLDLGYSLVIARPPGCSIGLSRG